MNDLYSRVVRKLRHNYYQLNHRLGREVIVPEKVGATEIRFKTSNYIEYLMRARESYRAEASTMHWIENCIAPDDVVYDIGANVGAYSLLIGKKIQQAKGSGTVYAFEPEGLNFSSLNKNILLNDLDGTILPVAVAIGDHLGFGKFYLSRFDYGAATHGLYEPKSDGKSFKPAHVQGSIVISVDQLTQLEGIRFPNHIKIDVDGLEGKIVKHMKSVLADPRLRTVVIEITENANPSAEIASVIQGFGFKEERRDTWRSEEDRVYNILFVR